MPRNALVGKRSTSDCVSRRPRGASEGGGKPGAVLSPAKALADNMRHLRKELFPGWGGQRRFAEFLGISPNDLCVYESARALPNEQRLEEMAKRLNVPVESLLRPLPGAKPATPRLSATAGRNGEDAMLREIVRLEAMNEVLQDQLAARETRIRELEESNLALRSLVYSESTPEGAERRRKLLERLEASFVGQGQEVF